MVIAFIPFYGEASEGVLLSRTLKGSYLSEFVKSPPRETSNLGQVELLCRISLASVFMRDLMSEPRASAI